MVDPFLATRQAFDSVADGYDGPLGNNLLIQKMRARTMEAVEGAFSRGMHLLDLGCGTGIDAAYLAARGMDIMGIDSSPAMVARANERLQRAGLTSRARAVCLGIQELTRLDANEFDGAYSDLGALNCLPDLRVVSAALASKLKPGARLVASVIGRYCPWEMGFYALRGHWRRARVRWSRGMAPVPLNGQTIWTRYYTPGEFRREFADEFGMVSLRGLSVLLPPPYLIHLYEQWPRLFDWVERADRFIGDKPAFRHTGDHFLVVLRKK